MKKIVDLLVAALILSVCVASADAAPILPPMTYMGAFFSPGPSADPGNYGGLAYYKDGSTEELYTVGSYNRMTIISVPTPVTPNTAWDNVPTAGNLVSAVATATRTSDAFVRDGYVYFPGYGGSGPQGIARLDLDLTNETFMGGIGTGNLTGLGAVPAGFASAAGIASDRDTVSISVYYSAPEFYLSAPQNGNGTTVPNTRLLRPYDYSNSTNWHYSYGAVGWIQPLGTTDWQDGFLVAGERDNNSPNQISLAFFDPVEVAAAKAADGDGIFAFSNSSITRLDLCPYLSPGNNNAAGITGMSYDPVTGRLFISETSTTSGAGLADAVIHVFQIPEPATMGLLALGTLCLAALRRRRN